MLGRVRFGLGRIFGFHAGIQRIGGPAFARDGIWKSDTGDGFRDWFDVRNRRNCHGGRCFRTRCCDRRGAGCGSRFRGPQGFQPHLQNFGEQLHDFYRARAGGIRTGLVSNSWGTRRYPRDLLAELFDAVVISGEVGLRKPHREMYALGAERIGLAPADCVFVDDLGVNLASAAKLGMTTVHHRAADDTIPELERLLGVSLR